MNATPVRRSITSWFLLGALVLAVAGCERKGGSGSPEACPATVPLARGCNVAHQTCDYEDGGKKYHCTCEPDTQGPSMWSCPVVN
jgi:hypothetical protein